MLLFTPLQRLTFIKCSIIVLVKDRIVPLLCRCSISAVQNDFVRLLESTMENNSSGAFVPGE